jgi:hypothetical protein
MAYMSQEKKAKIKEALKKVIPADWKWSLAVRNHSTICLTIHSAPIDLVADYATHGMQEPLRSEVIAKRHVDVNPYWWKDHFSSELVEVFRPIFEALNLDNHDRSDPMSDYYDVGHYVEVSIGRWNKPFVHKRPADAAG